MDIGTIAIIALVVIVLLVVFMSRRGSTGAGPVETPRYDNPNITSGSSFGGGPSAGVETPRYDNPRIQSGGSFGGGPAAGDSSPFGTSVGHGAIEDVRQGLRNETPSGGDHPQHDNPNIRSGGSFGG